LLPFFLFVFFLWSGGALPLGRFKTYHPRGPPSRPLFQCRVASHTSGLTISLFSHRTHPLSSVSFRGGCTPFLTLLARCFFCVPFPHFRGLRLGLYPWLRVFFLLPSFTHNSVFFFSRFPLFHFLYLTAPPPQRFFMDLQLGVRPPIPFLVRRGLLPKFHCYSYSASWVCFLFSSKGSHPFSRYVFFPF